MMNTAIDMKGTRVIELDSTQEGTFLSPERPLEILPGVTAIGSPQTREALIEVDRKNHPGKIAIGEEPVYAVKPWRNDQTLEVNERKFVQIPHLGAFVYSGRSTIRNALLEQSLETTTPPVSSIVNVTSGKKSKVKSLPLLIAGSIAALGLVSYMKKSPQVEPHTAEMKPRAKSVLVETAPAKPEPQTVAPTMEPAPAAAVAIDSAPVSPQGPETPSARPAAPEAQQEKAPIVTTPKVVAKLSPAKVVKAKEGSTAKEVPKSSKLSAAEQGNIRAQLQRISLESRFDPERARSKMQALLLKAKGHAALTQAIRQEMALIQ